VISDDSDDSMRPEVQEIAKLFQARWIAGPRRGLYANRNHVVTACLGSHIRTADDDHELPEDHFALCVDAVKLDPSAIWIIGEYVSSVHEDMKPPHPCPGQLHPRGFSEPPRHDQGLWALADGASIFPRFVFDCGFRYAERFQFGAAYLEFGSLLYAKGFRIRHLESTYIIHHYNPDTRSFLSRVIDLESRMFAMFCHSFVYQPTLKNKLLTTSECIRQLASNRDLAVGVLKASTQAFRMRRQEVARIFREDHQGSLSVEPRCRAQN
jgi:glycosyltransferase involved in cell wall biosynthesis